MKGNSDKQEKRNYARRQLTKWEAFVSLKKKKDRYWKLRFQIQSKIYSPCHMNEAKAELKALRAASLAFLNRGTFSGYRHRRNQPQPP